MKRIRKVPVACLQCKRAHLSCSDVRPCERCVAKHIAHLCNDHTLQPQESAFTEDEMSTIANILGTNGFELLKDSEEQFDFLQASSELDYANIFLQDATTFVQNKVARRELEPEIASLTAITLQPKPCAPPAKRPIARVSSSSSNHAATSTPSNPHTVHGIKVNQPPATNGTSSPPRNTNTSNRLNNLVLYHSPEEQLAKFYGYVVPAQGTSWLPPPETSPHISTPQSSQSAPYDPLIPVFTSTPTLNALSPPPIFTPSALPSSYDSTPLSPASHSPALPAPTSPSPPSSLSPSPSVSASPSHLDSSTDPTALASPATSNSQIYLDAITSALALRNAELEAKVSQMEDTQAKLQRALEEKDRQLLQMQERQRQEQSRLKILVQCRVMPQLLDISLVGRSKTFGIMTALYDFRANLFLDYNRNFEKMLVEIHGENYDITKVKLLPGPMECGVESLVNLMIKDYFRESLEKYTYIRLPNGDKLPFLFSLTIQCWERAAGPLISLTWWL